MLWVWVWVWVCCCGQEAWLCVAADDEKLPSLIDGDLYIFLAELGTGQGQILEDLRGQVTLGRWTRWDSYRRAAPLGRFAGEPGVQDRAALEASLGMVER